MGHYDNCKPENCIICGQLEGYCEHTNAKEKSFTVQVGGDHYKKLPIQPAIYSQKNELGWMEGEIVKYVTRHKFKGKKQDLEKARHIIDMLIEVEYES